jgi:hypothetical protein
MSRLLHPSWFNQPNNVRLRTEVMKFIIMRFPSRSVSIPFRSKYPPQHSVLKKNLQPTFLPQSERPSLIPIKYNCQNHSFV